MRPSVVRGRILRRRASRDHDIDDLVRNFADVAVFDQLKKGAFERSLADALANFGGGTVRDDLAFSQDD